jgi:RNA polymerase sigma-B factor
MTDHEALVARYADDRSRANREAVIAAYRYLCKRGARKFRRAESELADLEQVAALGLIKAVDSYRRERSTPFEPYAWLVIVGELMHYVRDHERAIRIPRWMRALERRYTRTWELVAARDHTEPTVSQLALELEVQPEIVHALQSLRRGNRADDADPETPRARLQCDALPAPAPTITLEERLLVHMAVDELPERERIVVLGTFAAGLSQTEIALMIGVSQSQVSKILNRALSKIHKRVA